MNSLVTACILVSCSYSNFWNYKINPLHVVQNLNEFSGENGDEILYGTSDGKIGLVSINRYIYRLF